MADDYADQFEQLLEVRASLWEAILDTRNSLVERGDRDVMEEFADHLLAAARQWRSLAAGADPVCRGILLTDADRYETTAMDLKLQAAA